MLVHAAAAVELVRGKSVHELKLDWRTKLALERALEVLGEAAGKVPGSVKAKYPDLAWRQMTALRNRLAHGYFSIDFEVLYRIAVEILPEQMPRLREIVTLEGADRPPQSP
jgi:uncharacterized protein with HEPN domain